MQPDALDTCIHASRLLGANPHWVLHGGGNTSVKDGDTLWVKGSGRDLSEATRADFTPLKLTAVRALLERDFADNHAMYVALDAARLDKVAPKPSIETLLHASINAPHVQHCHAANVLALANTVHGDDIVREVLSKLNDADAAIAPYAHSGAELARACRDALSGRDTQVLILMHHGLVTWGETAEEAHRLTVEIVTRIETALRARNAWDLAQAQPSETFDWRAIARLRQAASRVAGRALVATQLNNAEIAGFVARPDAGEMNRAGPATPGHAVYAKRYALFGSDVADYASRYAQELQGSSEVDCAPRVVFDASFGLCTLGVTHAAAHAAADIAINDMGVAQRAQSLGGYRTVSDALLIKAELEYAGFEARVTRTHPKAGRVIATDNPEYARKCLEEGQCVGFLGASSSELSALLAHPTCLHIAPETSAEEACAHMACAFGGVDELHGAQTQGLEELHQWHV
jgi:rhamnose utilization protein RhaD (predicted bifunctional aldolase and dehydrogenase)